MVRLAYFSVFVFLALAGPLAAGNPDKQPNCAVTAPDNAACGSGWRNGNRFVIHAKSKSQDIRAEWRYEIAENRDLKLGVSINSGENTESGAVFLIDSSTMLTNGLTLTPGQEIDTLGVPVLTLQLVLDLLERTFPGGPSEIHGKQPARDADNAAGLKIAARGVKGYIPAPWRLNGAVERVSSSKISFDLTLAFKPMLANADEQVMQFTGFWEQRPIRATFSDATKIEGWAIHRITQIKDPDSGPALNEFRATPMDDAFPTLGALRKHISANPLEDNH